jgi:hypothetical protein
VPNEVLSTACDILAVMVYRHFIGNDRLAPFVLSAREPRFSTGRSWVLLNSDRCLTVVLCKDNKKAANNFLFIGIIYKFAL